MTIKEETVQTYFFKLKVSQGTITEKKNNKYKDEKDLLTIS